jgi:hypothetical protein
MPDVPDNWPWILLAFRRGLKKGTADGMALQLLLYWESQWRAYKAGHSHGQPQRWTPALPMVLYWEGEAWEGNRSRGSALGATRSVVVLVLLYRLVPGKPFYNHPKKIFPEGKGGLFPAVSEGGPAFLAELAIIVVTRRHSKTSVEKTFLSWYITLAVKRHASIPSNAGPHERSGSNRERVWPE